MQMVQAINAGNADAAQAAYTNFTQSPAANLTAANPDSLLTQALGQIGQSLQSGDVSGAQQALQAIRPHGHGGRHHHGSGGTQSSAGSATSADPNAPGATVNLIA